MKFESNALNTYIRRIEKYDDLFLLAWPEGPESLHTIRIFIDIAKNFGMDGRLSIAKCILNRLRPLVVENSSYDLCMSFIDVNLFVDHKLTQSANPERG